MERDRHMVNAKGSDDAQRSDAAENDGSAGPKFKIHGSSPSSRRWLPI